MGVYKPWSVTEDIDALISHQYYHIIAYSPTDTQYKRIYIDLKIHKYVNMIQSAYIVLLTSFHALWASTNWWRRFACMWEVMAVVFFNIMCFICQHIAYSRLIRSGFKCHFAFSHVECTTLLFGSGCHLVSLMILSFSRHDRFVRVINNKMDHVNRSSESMEIDFIIYTRTRYAILSELITTHRSTMMFTDRASFGSKPFRRLRE